MTAMEFVRSNIIQFSALAFLAMIAVEQIAIRLFHRRGKTPLKDSGVSIPLPQSDVTLRDSDGLRRLTEALSGRGGSAAI